LQILFSLIGWIIHAYVMVIMIRFLAHAVGVPYSNQVMELLYTLTRSWSAPLRSVLPVVGGFDLSLLCVAYGLLMLKYSFPMIAGLGFSTFWLAMALAELFSMVIDIFFFSLIISIIVSFLAPGLYHPVLQVVKSLTEPLLAPVKRFLPPINGFDLSPIPVILFLKASEMIVHSVLL